MNELQGSIQIRITLSNYTQIGRWDTDLTTNNNTCMVLQNIELHCMQIFSQTIAAYVNQLEQLKPTR